MIIYLYIKTHSITGLKYLGKTVKDPYKYLGSGLDWKDHLKKYGTEVTTEILKECQSHEELTMWGRYYSAYYNVVNAMDDFGNKIWANRIPETGSGPGYKGPAEHYKKMASKRKGVPNPNISIGVSKSWQKSIRKEKQSSATSGSNHYSARPGYESKLKGCNNPMAKKENVEKAKSTFFKKYGSYHPMKNETVVEKVSGKNHYTKKSGYESKISGDNHYSKKSDFVCKTSGEDHYTKKPSWKIDNDNKNFDHTIYIWQNKLTMIILHLNRREMMNLNPELRAPSVCALIKGNLKSYKNWIILEKI